MKDLSCAHMMDVTRPSGPKQTAKTTKDDIMLTSKYFKNQFENYMNIQLIIYFIDLSSASIVVYISIGRTS